MFNPKLKFVDGTPVPDDYAQTVANLVHDAALATEIWTEDELEEASRPTCTHPPHRLHSWHAFDGTLCVACNDCGTPLAGMAKLVITPFRIDRITHNTCSQCGAKTEVEIGHDVLIDSNTRTYGPLKAIEECPTCGTIIVDPTPYQLPNLS